MNSFVTFVGELPEPEDSISIQIKKELMSHPGSWAEISLGSPTTLFFYNIVRRNANPEFPLSNFDIRSVDGKIYMRYIPN